MGISRITNDYPLQLSYEKKKKIEKVVVKSDVLNFVFKSNKTGNFYKIKTNYYNNLIAKKLKVL